MDQLNKKEKVKNERYFAAGDTIKVTPSFVADPRTRVQSAEWELGEKDVRQAEEVEEQEISFDTEGPQVLRLTVTTEEGQEITGETTIWIGEKPAPHVVYDVSLDHASRWSGPWRVIGQEWPGKLQRYRLVPNRGAATDPVLYGGTFVDDPEEGRVLEVNAQEGLWGERSQLTVNDDDGHSSKTISFRFKADDTSGRQTLYSEGHANAGFNVYLDDGMLYAGGWGVKEKFGSWDGNWISTDGIKAGTWYRVDLVLNDATDQVQDGKLHLYLDGEKVASGPAKRLPKHHSAPRLGRARSTRFHSGQTGGSPGLEGRLADFRVINAVRQPGK